MPQLTKGARTALDRIEALATDIKAELAHASAQAKFDPDAARDHIAQALDYLDDILMVTTDKLTPLLERQAPEYEKRLTALEQRVRDIEAARTVIPFAARKEA